VRTHKDLEAWKKAMALAKDTYLRTESFPRSEQFGLLSQTRRAAVSIPANIAEGAGRGSTREFAQFVTISRGSLVELETLLMLARDVGILRENHFAALDREIQEVGVLLNGLLTSLRRKCTANSQIANH
jgi:four helix bundle protein